MACLGVKLDGNYHPHRAKSRIFVFGNHEDFAFNNSQRFAPVLSHSSLWILASKDIEKGHILQQGDYKNLLTPRRYRIHSRRLLATQ